MPVNRLLIVASVGVVLALAGCKGAPGKDANDGEPGAVGQPGCTVKAGETGIGLHISVDIAEPANGQFFKNNNKESLTVTIKFEDGCNNAVDPVDLDVANLYITGPRTGLKTRAAARLLNAVVDRNASDDQHHFIDLQDPHFADPTQDNFGQAEDGSIIFHSGIITDEEPGTYMVGVWARTKDEEDQVFVSSPFQIGTATKEEYSAGRPGAFPACGRCHWGPVTGKIYMAHSHPLQTANAGLSAPKRLKGMPTSYTKGNWALDILPIETCQHCHNQDSYSRFPLVAKVHGVHRGHHMESPGQAHTYMTDQVAGGLPFDESMAQYTDVGFPSFPDGEKDCTQCHIDKRFQTNPSPLACVGCHETLDLSTGVRSPARVYGRPGANKCTVDQECVDRFSTTANCNTVTGNCENRRHITITDTFDDDEGSHTGRDCAACHTADDSGSSPIPKRHEILIRTKSLGIQLVPPDPAVGFVLKGGTGPDGTVLPKDVLTLEFKFQNREGAALDLNEKTATGGDKFSLSLMVSGPTTDRQRVLTSVARTQITAPAGGGDVWTLTIDNKNSGGVVQGFPTVAQLPINQVACSATVTTNCATARTNPAGTYSLFFYVVYSANYGGTSGEEANAYLDFNYCPSSSNCSTTVRPLKVILDQACNSCHVKITAVHGGRRTNGEICSMCHTAGAIDANPGNGGACAKNEDCAGYDADPALSWEECYDRLGANGQAISATNPADGVVDTCRIPAENRKGAACAQDAECFGFAAGWEKCKDTTVCDGSTPPVCKPLCTAPNTPTGCATLCTSIAADGTKTPTGCFALADGVDTCVVETANKLGRDPTGQQSIQMTNMTHALHYARRRGGFSSQSKVLKGLYYLGRGNAVEDFSEILLPLDMRNCTKCHFDTGEACVEEADTCAVGQQCRKGRCENVSWKAATNGEPCLACHDTKSAWTHIQLNTFTDASGNKSESCGACHGENRIFSPAKVHNISAPYLAPYPRTFATHE